jgi:hypothetical protein
VGVPPRSACRVAPSTPRHGSVREGHHAHRTERVLDHELLRARAASVRGNGPQRRRRGGREVVGLAAVVAVVLACGRAAAGRGSSSSSSCSGRSTREAAGPERVVVRCCVLMLVVVVLLLLLLLLDRCRVGPAVVRVLRACTFRFSGHTRHRVVATAASVLLICC